MKNFEVHEMVDGWTGQVSTLAEAIALRDEIIDQAVGYVPECKITAEVDESDL